MLLKNFIYYYNIMSKKDKKVKIEKSVKTMLKEEENFGIKNFKTYQKFGEKVYKIREINKFLKNEVI